MEWYVENGHCSEPPTLAALTAVVELAKAICIRGQAVEVAVELLEWCWHEVHRPWGEEALCTNLVRLWSAVAALRMGVLPPLPPSEGPTLEHPGSAHGQGMIGVCQPLEGGCPPSPSQLEAHGHLDKGLCVAKSARLGPALEGDYLLACGLRCLVLGDLPRAESLLQDAFEVSERVCRWGVEACHQPGLLVRCSLARLLSMQGRTAEAVELATATCRQAAQALGSRHYCVLYLRQCLQDWGHGIQTGADPAGEVWPCLRGPEADAPGSRPSSSTPSVSVTYATLEPRHLLPDNGYRSFCPEESGAAGGPVSAGAEGGGATTHCSKRKPSDHCPASPHRHASIQARSQDRSPYIFLPPCS